MLFGMGRFVDLVQGRLEVPRVDRADRVRRTWPGPAPGGPPRGRAGPPRRPVAGRWDGDRPGWRSSAAAGPPPATALGVVEPQGDPLEGRRFPLAVQVVAGLRGSPAAGRRGSRRPPPGRPAGPRRAARSGRSGPVRDRSGRAPRDGSASSARRERWPPDPVRARPVVPAGAGAVGLSARTAGGALQFLEPAVEGRDGDPEPLRERVEGLGHLDVQPRGVRPRDAAEDRQDPFGGEPRVLERVEVEPRLGPGDREAQRVDRPIDQVAERVGPLPGQEVARVEAVRASLAPGRRSRGPGRVPGPDRRPIWPASSPSKTRTTRSASRRRACTWSSPSAVPRVPTTLGSPAWWAAMTSV